MAATWPGHFNRPIAEALQENINSSECRSGLTDDQTLAKGIQAELGSKTDGLKDAVAPLEQPANERIPGGGGSDDISEVSWNVPTVVLRFPGNIPERCWPPLVFRGCNGNPIAHKVR